MAGINWSALGNKQKAPTEKKDTSYLFKLTKDEHQLRIVPFPLNSKVFDSDYFNEDNNLFVELSVHNKNMIPYTEDKMTLVIDSIGEVDPITKFSKQLRYDNVYKDTSEAKAKLDVAKSMFPDRYTYCCVIDREDEEPTPYLWRVPLFKDVVPLFARASVKLKKKLKIDEEDEFYEFDVNEGFDITVESTIKKSNIEGRNAEYRAVSSISFDTDATPVAETKDGLKEIYSKMVNPFKLYHIKSAKELQAILDKAMNGDDEDDADAGEEIKTKAKPKQVAPKRVLPEDDEDDDETPPPTKPATKEKSFDALFKKGGKKALEDDDCEAPF